MHLEQGIEAADPGPYVPPMQPVSLGAGREMLAESRAFTLERWRGEAERVLDGGSEPAWLIMVQGAGWADGQRLEPGSVWLAEGPVSLQLDEGAELLVAYPDAQR